MGFAALLDVQEGSQHHWMLPAVSAATLESILGFWCAVRDGIDLFFSLGSFVTKPEVELPCLLLLCTLLSVESCKPYKSSKE